MNKLVSATSSIAIVACLLCWSSCKEERIEGEGKVITQHRDVETFTRVILDLPADADIRLGDAQSLDVKTHGNLQEYILTEVSEGTLRIYMKSGLMKYDFSDIDVSIHLPAISKLEINGAADAKIVGEIKGEEFELHVRGASDVEVESMDVKKLIVRLSGASELDIRSGTVGYAEYKVTGAGEVNAAKLETKQAKARVSGAGDMDLFVTGKLDARISGAGEIGYTGHPELISKVTGIGSITDKN